MIDIEQYHSSESEKARTSDLLRILPRGRRSVLDVGARDGYYSRLLTDHFAEVTALDLKKPTFEIPGVQTIQGDATRLEFPDNSFDCVFCTEVLEHVPRVEEACAELLRVAKHEVILGVPFRQDTRVGRTTCRTCGTINPPWGHLNSFDEARLMSLFSGARIISQSFVGKTAEVTNLVSTFLFDLAGNPWGVYEQDEPCVSCGAKLVAPERRGLPSRLCAAVAVRLNRIQALFARPRANWIHLSFSKTNADGGSI